MANQNPYIGKIGNAGAQVVKGTQSGKRKGTTKATTGGDLRTGKK